MDSVVSSNQTTSTSPPPTETVEFDLSRIPGLSEAVTEAMDKIYEDIADRNSSRDRILIVRINVNPLSFHMDGRVLVKLPPPETEPIKLSAQGIRENGVLKLEVLAVQANLF